MTKDRSASGPPELRFVSDVPSEDAADSTGEDPPAVTMVQQAKELRSAFTDGLPAMRQAFSYHW